MWYHNYSLFLSYKLKDSATPHENSGAVDILFYTAI